MGSEKISSIIIVMLLIIAFVGYNQIIKHQQIREKKAVINTAEKAIKSQKEFRGETIKIKILNITKNHNNWSISYKYAKTGINVVPNIWLPFGGGPGGTSDNGFMVVNVKEGQNGKLQAYFPHY